MKTVGKSQNGGHQETGARGKVCSGGRVGCMAFTRLREGGHVSRGPRAETFSPLFRAGHKVISDIPRM